MSGAAPAGTPIKTKKKSTDESKAPLLAGERKPSAAKSRVSKDMTSSCIPVPAYCEIRAGAKSVPKNRNEKTKISMKCKARVEKYFKERSG